MIECNTLLTKAGVGTAGSDVHGGPFKQVFVVEQSDKEAETRELRCQPDSRGVQYYRSSPHIG